MGTLINNPAIQEQTLLVPKNILSRIYIWPFLIIYPLFLQTYFMHYETHIGGSEWTFVYLIAMISLNSVLALMSNWNVDVDVFINYNKVKSIAEASHIKIVPAPNSGLPEICKLEREVFRDGEKRLVFLYQKRRHFFDEKTQQFSPPQFLFDEEPKLKVYQETKGLCGDLEKLKRLYGENRFNIPIPTFLELFKEHAVAPFFVFQIFCIALWLLDEQWYYSLLSLFMTVAFEMTTVFQRRTTMSEFQSMGIKSYSMYAYRSGQWNQVETHELLPGDVVSINRNKEDLSLPCDLLLIDGSCIVNEAMLSGESTPLLKESIKLRPPEERLQPEGFDKNSLLHGGTGVLQITAPQEPSIPLAPDAGALAVVVKTGFETTQGSLVRMMIFTSERVSVGNKEAFLFILFLLVFAIAASWYVWVEGSRMGRIQSKLILDCVIIITSVVPPELPMELTMAVNSSLASLQKFYIYCTEPFRIPFGGRVDVCCFDKTGTLTTEDLVFEGLAGYDENSPHRLYSVSEVPKTTLWVLGTAHALVRLEDGEVIGDSMEQATLKASNWSIEKNGTLKRTPESEKPENIKILRRFQFSSSLKRSSAISSVSSLPGKLLVAVKGAPETLGEMFVDAPAKYDDIYKSFTRSGSRVLALGYKYLPQNAKVTKIDREEVESQLHFAGLIVFHCPLKQDAIETIKMLNESSHRSIMITGDNPLTACHVAKEVAILEREVLILDEPESHHKVLTENLVWRNADESIVIPFNSTEKLDDSILQKFDLCLTGHALEIMRNHSQIVNLLKHCWVFARVSPKQKEFILKTYKDAGYNTLMCGDGTNDVGALKQAHIGVALLDGSEETLKKMAENKKIEANKTVYDKQCQLLQRWGKPAPPVPPLIAHLYPPGVNNPKYLEALEKRGVTITDDMRREVAVTHAQSKTVQTPLTQKSNPEVKSGDLSDLLSNAMNDAQAEDEAPALKLGDASVAAPFTSKLANVSSVTHIIRQGRCALVSTIQMYKILALNCLISAYSLSVLYLAGIKFGDMQSTVSGLLLSVCFFSVSKGRPLEKLSKERPQDKIFTIYIMGSILGQFATHIITLLYISKEVSLLEPREPQVDLEKSFEPSLLNTAIFLLQLAQQVSTFAINYQGLPFRESIKDNKGMYYGLLGVLGLSLAGSTEFMPEMNQAMKFVPMEFLFKVKLTACILGDLGISWGIELFLKHFFMRSQPADIAIRD